MIYVKIQKTHNCIESFTMTGHANFAEYGSDIVCAAVSAVAIGAINAVEELTGHVLPVEMGGDGGYLYCTVPKDLPEETNQKIQLLLSGMIVSLQTIERDYGRYIKITFKK